MPSKKLTVLLAEDEKSINKAFTIGFESAGFKVISTFCGIDCLEEADKHIPDIVLLDLFMPKMDGETTLRELKKGKKTKDIPVVILTNFSDEEKAKNVMSLGAQGFLIKSNNTLDQVVKKVEDVLSR